MIKKEYTVADPIKTPSHYNSYKGFEVMDICNQMRSSDDEPSGTWHRANAVKYLLRAGKKDAGNLAKEIEDLKKAQQYLGLEIARLETVQIVVEANKQGEKPPAEHEQEETLKLVDIASAMIGRERRLPSKYICPECDGVLYPNRTYSTRTLWTCHEGHGSVLIMRVAGPDKCQTNLPKDLTLILTDKGIKPSRLLRLFIDERVAYKDRDAYAFVGWDHVPNPDWCYAKGCGEHPRSIKKETLCVAR